MPDLNDTLLTNDPEELFAQEIEVLDRWFRSEIASIIVRLGKKEINTKQARYETKMLQEKYRTLVYELPKRF